ncbi:hypothetical protein BDV27DRAFT_124627 [Aspergillus caelatus]|uniref:Uncharacterized protein n=1 Tax=Aspergillus caelatus TaxID=61420 RepID=A0A5N7AC73_9EURO|nr:uncharacterized protein BDV27DRAFT_124627 [Aspergillus caelatus]KAE8366938.1 hypothetical protein BDV27DRAFT_124627 [Aspergillus caelatus]
MLSLAFSFLFLFLFLFTFLAPSIILYLAFRFDSPKSARVAGCHYYVFTMSLHTHGNTPSVSCAGYP